MPTTAPEPGAPSLPTERLVLRPAAQADIPAILPLAGEDAVARWTRAIPHPLAGDDVRAWLASHVWADDAAGERAFAVTLKTDGTLVGAVGLTVDPDRAEAEIGYWIGVPFQGQGYATEAVRRVLRYGFGDLKLTRVFAPVFDGNDPSVRVLEKAGFLAGDRVEVDASARGGLRTATAYAIDRQGFARAALSAAVGR